MSTPDPGPSGSRNFTGRCGQLWARAAGAESRSGASRPKASSECRPLRTGPRDLTGENRRDIRAFSIGSRTIHGTRRDCAPSPNDVVPLLLPTARDILQLIVARPNGKGVGHAGNLIID